MLATLASLKAFDAIRSKEWARAAEDTTVAVITTAAAVRGICLRVNEIRSSHNPG